MKFSLYTFRIVVPNVGFYRVYYFGKETDVLYCIIAPRELYRLERIVYSIDPDAFVVMSRATSVHGKGFSKAKEYIVQQ